jgi:hypothetical protein
MPKSMVEQRNAHYLKNSQDAQASVDNNLMRESNPRMPINRPENKTRVTFGSGG